MPVSFILLLDIRDYFSLASKVDIQALKCIDVWSTRCPCLYATVQTAPFTLILIKRMFFINLSLMVNMHNNLKYFVTNQVQKLGANI